MCDIWFILLLKPGLQKQSFLILAGCYLFPVDTADGSPDASWQYMDGGTPVGASGIFFVSSWFLAGFFVQDVGISKQTGRREPIAGVAVPACVAPGLFPPSPVGPSVWPRPPRTCRPPPFLPCFLWRLDASGKNVVAGFVAQSRHGALLFLNQYMGSSDTCLWGQRS